MFFDRFLMSYLLLFTANQQLETELYLYFSYRLQIFFLLNTLKEELSHKQEVGL